MSSEEPAFAKPWWVDDRDKHWPLYAEPWPKVVRGTADDAARYHPSLSLADIERMEIGCVGGGKQEDRGLEIVDKRKHNLKIYWKKMPVVIGASSGEETYYIFVEYGQMGNVHGRPITEAELRKKGAVL